MNAASSAGSPVGYRTSGRARVWIMVALALVAGGVALLVRDRDEPLPGVLAPGTREMEPEVFMEGAEISQFSIDGALEYQLDAAVIRHFENSRTQLAAPRLTLFDDRNSPWHASAQEGRIRRPDGSGPGPGAEELVDLQGDVVLEHSRDGEDAVRLSTQALQLYPQRRYAETDQDVMIQGLIGRTTAAGMQADLRAGLITLSGSAGAPVRTTLLPEQFK